MEVFLKKTASWLSALVFLTAKAFGTAPTLSWIFFCLTVANSKTNRVLCTVHSHFVSEPAQAFQSEQKPVLILCYHERPRD